MDINQITHDIFATLPSRFKKDQANNDLKAMLGIDLIDFRWTIVIENRRCTVHSELKKECAAIIKTGMKEWANISCGIEDPAALFLAKKLTVEGDMETALTIMPLFTDYQSELFQKKEPSWVIETLGPNFSVDEVGHFFIEDHDCNDLADRFGTPLFVTSEAQIRDNIRRLKKAFVDFYPENDANVMWAIKSNTTLAFRKIMNDEGAGGDCFSPGEVYATFLTGADPEKFLLNGSDRSDETFRMAMDVGMRITLDHKDDLPIVEKLARECGKQVRTLIRVKSDLPSLKGLKSTFYPGLDVHMEVLNYKFGVTYDEAVEIAKAAENCPHIKIEGIHSHIGRDIHLPEHWQKYTYDMVSLCSRFKQDTGITPAILDLGGGFAESRDPSSHDLTKMASSAESYVENVCQGVRRGCNDFNLPFPQLWIEPGRHLIGNTTVMLSRVGNVKRTPDVCTWVHTDASTNFLSGAIRHNGMSYHLLSGSKARDNAEELVDIVGPNCAGDLIQPRRRMPKLERGELLVFLDVGAYNMVYANQFNCIPRPAVALVSGKQVDIVCERETLQDVFAHQQIPARLLNQK